MCPFGPHNYKTNGEKISSIGHLVQFYRWFSSFYGRFLKICQKSAHPTDQAKLLALPTIAWYSITTTKTPWPGLWLAKPSYTKHPLRMINHLRSLQSGHNSISHQVCTERAQCWIFLLQQLPLLRLSVVYHLVSAECISRNGQWLDKCMFHFDSMVYYTLCLILIYI